MLNEIDTPVSDWHYSNPYDCKPANTQVPKTEEGIEQAASVEWLDVLSGMWEAIGKPLDEKRLNKYAKELSTIPLGLLERAVSRAIRNNGEYQVVPTIAAIWKAARVELRNPLDIDSAIERWVVNMYESGVRRFE